MMKIFQTENYPHALFLMVAASQKDYRGCDIPATIRNHPHYGKVKIFSGYKYGNNIEFRWSLSNDCGETDSKQNLLSKFGVI